MSFTSIQDVIDGLHERFATVSGLVQLDDNGDPVNLLTYEPASIQTTPTLYTLLDSFTRKQTGQITIMELRMLHRLVIQWQDNAEAESQLLDFVNSIPASIDQDMTLGGRITMGLSRITEGQSGFIIISDTKYRCMDFFSTSPVKAPVKSGI